MAKSRTDTDAVVRLVINGEQAKTTAKELSDAYRRFSNELLNMKKADDPRAYAEKAKQVQVLKSALDEARKEAAGLSTETKKLSLNWKEMAKGVVGGNLITSALEFGKQKVVEMVNKLGELSDSFADIRKTTGMTSGEVARFNAELKKIDTRTPTQDLRNIAVIAGQLGIAKDDVLGFTDSIDKLVVSLGDEFSGGAEEVADVTGKLRNVFQDIKSDQIDVDLLRIGNAINELGATGGATGPIVADFANRIGGVGIPLGLTSGQVLGLSATLQELNVSTELGGTAVTKILQSMLTKVNEFSAVAGMKVTEFKELLNTDLYGAFVRVVKGASASSDSSTKFAETLDKLGLDGAGTMQVMSKLASNTDLLKQRVDLASESIQDTSSIMNEFNLKNNNMAANMEKISKRFSEWWDKSAFMSFFEGLIGLLGDTRSEATKLTDAFNQQRSEVQQLDAKLTPLILRHDELKGKANLNKTEQLELKKAINGIAEIIPTAVTEWDKYGKAISINTGKAREFIAIQKALLAHQNKDAIEQARKELNRMGAERYRLIQSMNTAEKNTGYALGEKNLRQFTDRIKFLAAEMKKREVLLKGLRGDMLDIPAPGNTTPLTEEPVIPTPFGGKEKVDKEADYLQNLLDKMADVRDKAVNDRLEGLAKEEAVIKQNYDKERRELQENVKNKQAVSKGLIGIKEAEDAALTTLREKWKADEDKVIEELTADAKKELLDWTNDKAAIQEELYRALLSDEEREQAAIDQHYEQLYIKAYQHGEDTTAIFKKWEDEKLEAYKKRADAELKKEIEIQAEKSNAILDSARAVANSVMSIISNSQRAQSEARLSAIEDERRRELEGKELSKFEEEAINKKFDDRVRAEKRKAWQAQQRADIAQALINGALAMTKVSAQTGVLTFAFSPFVAAAVAAQIAVIAAQKPQFAKGGILPSGPSHAAGGINLVDNITGAVVGEIEGGEPILSKETYRNNKQTIDALLYSSQRRSGASISIDSGSVASNERYYRNGGLADRPSISRRNQSVPAFVDLTELKTMMGLMIDAVKEEKERPIVLNYRLFEKKQEEVNQITSNLNS